MSQVIKRPRLTVKLGLLVGAAALLAVPLVFFGFVLNDPFWMDVRVDLYTRLGLTTNIETLTAFEGQPRALLTACGHVAIIRGKREARNDVGIGDYTLLDENGHAVPVYFQSPDKSSDMPPADKDLRVFGWIACSPANTYYVRQISLVQQQWIAK